MPLPLHIVLAIAAFVTGVGLLAWGNATFFFTILKRVNDHPETTMKVSASIAGPRRFAPVVAAYQRLYPDDRIVGPMMWKLYGGLALTIVSFVLFFSFDLAARS